MKFWLGMTVDWFPAIYTVPEHFTPFKQHFDHTWLIANLEFRVDYLSHLTFLLFAPTSLSTPLTFCQIYFPLKWTLSLLNIFPRKLARMRGLYSWHFAVTYPTMMARHSVTGTVTVWGSYSSSLLSLLSSSSPALSCICPATSPLVTLSVPTTYWTWNQHAFH